MTRARTNVLGHPVLKNDSCVKRVPQLSAFCGMDSGGDGLSETTFENSTPAQSGIVVAIEMGNPP
jgi:hypothetical protein